VKVLRRIMTIAVAAGLFYGVSLVVLGFVLGGSVESRVRERLGEALRADVVEVGDVDLSLARGKVAVSDLVIRRGGPGTIDIAIDKIDVEMSGYGAMLWDRDVDRVTVSGADIDLSAVGAVTLKRGESHPVRVGELKVVDSRIAVSPTSLLPGLGRAELEIKSAHASSSSVNDSISWLFGIDELDADLKAPGDILVGVTYKDELLSVRGSVFGSDPITVPFSFPSVSLDDLEFKKIARLTRSLIKALAPELAKRKVSDVAGDVIDLIKR
jgi:hypothetical protein